MLTDHRATELGQRLAESQGHRAVLFVPLLQGDTVIGVLSVSKSAPLPFTDSQVALLQTFADQAVIAIENVRLFNETKEALDRQTTTSEILRVISSSPTDVQPVFDAIIESAARLCEVADGWIVLTEGDTLRGVSAVGQLVGQLPVYNARRVLLTRESVVGRAILDRTTIHIHDLAAVSEAEYPEGRALQRMLGHRTQLVTPLLREGVAIGAILLARFEVRLFSERQIELLKTFADQAVIAIENVRLFNETKEALEQQTATSEILKVISSSPRDVQPVFDTIVRSAVLLCGADVGTAVRFDGELMHLVAGYNYTPEVAQALHEEFPMRPSPRMMSGRAIISGDVVQVENALEDPNYSQEVARAGGFRSMLAAPMLRDGRPIGAIVVNRSQPGRFSPTQIDLLKTFADQAVIAIENVRLFTELQARTTELTRSVGELTALEEVSRALSSTLELETVLDTIVTRAVQLSNADAGTILEYDESAEVFHLRVSTEDHAVVAALRGTGLRKGEGAVGRIAVTRKPVPIPDIGVEGAYQSHVRETLLRSGRRAVLALPLLREEHIIGGLVITRNAPGEFPAETIELLQTFATQSALAIQNARLFREIEQKSRELEAASRHKSEFLANMSHELRTPLNAVIGFSEVLSERMFGDLNEKQDEYLKDIHASGQHLLSLINDILDLSKIEAGRMDLELSDFNLPATLDNALTLVRERAGRRGITLDLIVDDRLEQIRGDERKLRQVVLNLLSNAIKFTAEGGRIRVRAVPVDGSAEVSVTDTGVGIAPEDQEAIFEEFKQVGTAEKKVEGTGLGLALSRKFIELHGGKIWVKSQVGTGSTFTFTVPVRCSE